MKSILLLVFSHLKHRKLQSLLISMIILVATLSFTIGLSMLQVISDPFEQAFESQKGAHLILLFDKETYDEEALYTYWNDQIEVESVTEPLNQISDLNTCYIKGEPTTNNLYYTEMPINPINSILKIAEGEEKPYPLEHQVWLNTNFAQQNKIEVGDLIEIGTSKGLLSYTVSALVIDLPYNSGFMNPVRAWFAPGEFQRNFPAGEAKTASLSIRLKEAESQSKVWQDFEDYLGAPFSGLKLDKELVFSAYSFQIQIMGSILLLFSIIAIVIALYVLISTVNSTVLNAYQQIGVYRSLGLTPNNVNWLFVLQHTVLAFLFIPAGAVMGMYLTTTLTKSFLSSLGIVTSFYALIQPAAISCLIMIALLLICGWLVSKKAGNVKPAEAIRYGLPSEKMKKTPLIMIQHLGNKPLTFILSIKEILNNKRQSLFSFITLFFTAVIIMFSIILYFSLDGMAQNAAFWGMDTSDLSVSMNSATTEAEFKAFEDFLANNDTIETLATQEFLVNTTIGKTSNHPSQGFIGAVYGGDLDAIGLINIEGKNPRKSNEIAVAVNTQKKYDLQLGDSFEIYFEGVKKTFIISGIYQGVNNMGQGFRVHESAIFEIKPNYRAYSYLIKTKDKEASDQLYEALDQRYGKEINLVKTIELFESTTESITSSMGLSVVVMSLIFLFVAIVTIYNTTLLHINKHKKTFGIYKSIGLTNQQIRYLIIEKYVVLSLIAGAIALPSSYILTDVIMVNLMGVMGIHAFPVLVNIALLIGIIPILCLFSFVSSWHASHSILKIHPRELLMD